MSFAIVHVPKCGGLSLGKKLEAAGFPRLPWDAPAPVAQEALAVHGGVIGHVPACTYAQAQAREIVAIVREPVSRLVSFYRYMRMVGYVQSAGVPRIWQAHLRMSQGTFNDFLATDRLWGPPPHPFLSFGHMLTGDGRIRRSRPGSRGRPHPQLDRVYWDHEQDDLLRHLGLPATPGPRLNASRPLDVFLSAPQLDRDLLARTVRADERLLQRLMADGRLTRRSASDLAAEREAALRLVTDPSRPQVPLEVELIGHNHLLNAVLSHGWGELEPSWVWTNAPTTGLLLPVGAREVRMIVGHRPNRGGQARLGVQVDDGPVRQWRLPAAGEQVALRVPVREEDRVLRMYLWDRGPVGADPRHLGVALHSLQFG